MADDEIPGVPISDTGLRLYKIAMISSYSKNKREWWVISRLGDNILIDKEIGFDEVNIPSISTCYLQNGLLYCLGGKIDGKTSNQIISYLKTIKAGKLKNKSLLVLCQSILVLGAGGSNFGEIILSKDSVLSFSSFVKGCCVQNIDSFAFDPHSLTVYVWDKNIRLHQQYHIGWDKWENFPEELGSKTPRTFQSLIFRVKDEGALLLAVCDDDWLSSYSFSKKQWSQNYKLRTKSRKGNGEKIHMIKASSDRVCLVYECVNRKVNCYLFQVTRGKIKPLNGGVAFDILEDSSLLSTVTSVWIPDLPRVGDSGKKRKMIEMEITTAGDGAEKRYHINSMGDFDTFTREVMFCAKNTCPHFINDGNLLTCVIPSNGSRSCVHERYMMSLQDYIDTFGKGRLWNKFKFDNNVEGCLFDMSTLLSNIILQAYRILIKFRRRGFTIKEVNSLNIVFLEGDNNLEIPKLIACRILGSKGDVSSGFKSLASLILHCMMPEMTEDLLSPCLKSLIKCLNGETSADAWITKKMGRLEWEYLFFHPGFLNHQQRYEYLDLIRNDLRGGGQLSAFGAVMADLAPGFSSPCWRDLYKVSYLKVDLIRDHVNRIQDKRLYDFPDHTAVHEYVKSFRDLCTHGNDGVQKSDIRSPTYYGELLDQISPGLLPAHFERHGGLVESMPLLMLGCQC